MATMEANHTEYSFIGQQSEWYRELNTYIYCVSDTIQF